MKRIIFKYFLDSGMACYVWAFDSAKNGKRIPLLNSNKITAKMSSSIHLNKYDIFKIMSWGHRKQITWRQAQNSIETSPQLLETCIFETFSFIIFSCPILCSFFLHTFWLAYQWIEYAGQIHRLFFNANIEVEFFCDKFEFWNQLHFVHGFPFGFVYIIVQIWGFVPTKLHTIKLKTTRKKEHKKLPRKELLDVSRKISEFVQYKNKKRDPLELLGFLLPKNLTLILQLL